MACVCVCVVYYFIFIFFSFFLPKTFVLLYYITTKLLLQLYNMKFFVSSLLLLGAVLGENLEGNPAYVCSFCILALGLVEESLFQVHIERYLQQKCTDDACKKAIEKLILSIEAKAVPETICRDMTLCQDECTVFSTWPVNPLPAKPIDWPVERRLDEVDMTVLKPIFTQLVSDAQAPGLPTMGVVAAALGAIRNSEDYGNCDNVTCKIISFVDGHLPLLDHDQDRFATAEHKRLRGSDWRGADCNDDVRAFYFVPVRSNILCLS
jgi:hypothetical protein